MSDTPMTDAAIARGECGPDFARDLERKLAACRAEVATQDAKDAARYRWLRGRAWPFTFQGDNPEDADAAVDEAMEKDLGHDMNRS